LYSGSVLDAGRVFPILLQDKDNNGSIHYQDASTARDVEFAENLNGLLQDPEYDMRWNIPIASTGPQASTSTAGGSTSQAPYVPIGITLKLLP